MSLTFVLRLELISPSIIALLFQDQAKTLFVKFSLDFSDPRPRIQKLPVRWSEISNAKFVSRRLKIKKVDVTKTTFRKLIVQILSFFASPLEL